MIKLWLFFAVALELYKSEPNELWKFSRPVVAVSVSKLSDTEFWIFKMPICNKWFVTEIRAKQCRHLLKCNLSWPANPNTLIHCGVVAACSGIMYWSQQTEIHSCSVAMMPWTRQRDTTCSYLYRNTIPCHHGRNISW